MGQGLDTSKLQIPTTPTTSPREDLQSAEVFRSEVGAVLEDDTFRQDDIEAFMMSEGIVGPDEDSKLVAIDAEYEVKKDRPSGTRAKGQPDDWLDDDDVA